MAAVKKAFSDEVHEQSDNLIKINSYKLHLADPQVDGGGNRPVQAEDPGAGQGRKTKVMR